MLKIKSIGKQWSNIDSSIRKVWRSLFTPVKFEMSCRGRSLEPSTGIRNGTVVFFSLVFSLHVFQIFPTLNLFWPSPIKSKSFWRNLREPGLEPCVSCNWYVSLISRASSPLAQLYSTSTMEHHHFDQCLMILNSPGNQILVNLSSDDYEKVVKVLEDAILSTDLAVYFRFVWNLLTLNNLLVS